MTRLAALIPTPRAGKRLTNLYRLARIAIPDAELAAFVGDATGGPYQVVQLLLAILCGHPAPAHDIFQRLIAAPGGKHLSDVLATADHAALTHSPAQRLNAELMAIISETGLPGTVAPYQRWCPQLARYSFHTRDIAGRPADDLAG